VFIGKEQYMLGAGFPVIDRANSTSRLHSHMPPSAGLGRRSAVERMSQAKKIEDMRRHLRFALAASGAL
jgi:hypothetical protein